MAKVLGITISHRNDNPSGAGQAQIGWCLINRAARERVAKRGERVITKDPALAALDMATAQPGVPVDLTKYTSPAAFHGSRPHRDGMTLDEHTALIDRTYELLKTHGIDVTIVERVS